MKTFEEKFTAWVDGRLDGAELAAFERELEAHPEATRAKRKPPANSATSSAPHLPAPAPPERRFLQSSDPSADREPALPLVPSRRPSFWSLPRMAFSGVFLLLLATILYFAAVPKTRREVRRESSNTSKHPQRPLGRSRHYARPRFHSKQDNVNVVWLDGLNYMPPGPQA